MHQFAGGSSPAPFQVQVKANLANKAIHASADSCYRCVSWGLFVCLGYELIGGHACDRVSSLCLGYLNCGLREREL